MRACFYNTDGAEVGVVELRPGGNAAIVKGNKNFREYIRTLNVADLKDPKRPLVTATDGRRYIQNLWPYAEVEA